ncbi:MAG TPA: Ku protein [Candidatus Dormibacteraeota bacterium]|nr:Ku protein [Candidatus Dormibacteraeota bacterium]
MPRSMWRGAISFGMVAIPIRMYLATESRSVSFRLLCPNDQTPIKQKRWCPVEDREVGWTEAVRGFEVGKDEYVLIDDGDLDRLPLATSQTIEILEFVDDAEIEPGLFVKQAYYLEPEAVGAKPYRLLHEALARTGRVAIGRLALRDREHLVRLSVHDDGILLTTLHWPDEIRATDELKIPSEEVALAKGELDMAVMLVENLAGHFEPEKHRDRYRDALMEVVEEKMGKREARPFAEPEPPKVMDLMAALRASVEAAKQRQAEAGTASGADAETGEDAEGSERGGRRTTATAARTSRARSAAPAEPAGEQAGDPAAKPEPARRRKAS